MRSFGTAARLAAFGAGLVAVLGLGAGLGAAVGPHGSTTSATPAEDQAPLGGGVVATAEGYRLVPLTIQLDPAGGPLRFTIERQNGVPVRQFMPVHERDLHLIVVNRELTVFHHVHPILGADGTWSIDLPALPPGSYRAVADFQVAGGPRLALGTDLGVAGSYRPTELRASPSHATVDGYDVDLATTRGNAGEVTAKLTVRKDGQLITDLEPYLGASGHLVAMRAGDLAYAHVHPVDREGGAGTVLFDAELSSAGRYGLFFDFKHGGIVHTAPFVFDQGAVTGATNMEH
jgi:hypothetical protein